MKRLVSSLMAAAMLTGAVAAGGALAESDAYIYGTMQIPYGAFYAAEGVASEVDAVTSATPTKWSSETLAAGTYSAAHEADAGGDILGVVYPVAITQESLDALADANYGFEALESVPEAYKIVSVEGGAAVFSAVQGETTVIEAEASLSDNTAYGDFVANVVAINNANGSSDVGTIYGVLLKTTDGAVYGLRHLENIWLDQLAWSVGFVTEERSGNALSSEDYADMMIAIMLPLFITSFKRVRRRMKPGNWKRLQRLAYVFYGLMYIHVLLLNLRGARTSAAAQCTSSCSGIETGKEKRSPWLDAAHFICRC